MDKFIIVGGGTAGLVSSLILKKRFPQKEVQLIESSTRGIVGVGESSTEHFLNFCNYVDIPIRDFITKANATFKLGIYFENWGKEDYIHSVDDICNGTYGDYYHLYGYIISHKKPNRSLIEESVWENKIFENLDDYHIGVPGKQLHFDTYALNEYLHKECFYRGIEIIEDDLIDVQYDQNGNISCVVSETNKYEADFFIDCSGFKRFLSRDIPWKSYSKYLPLNSAITFETEEMEEYNLYTKATARKYGWSWTIPTQTRTGNGYVFCDRFINEDQAHKEMEEAYGQNLNIGKTFKFDPGRLETAWNKNCYSVGLSQSFIEPLEATSIGSIIQQVFCFMHYFPSYDYKTCNEKVNLIYDNMFDFVQSHYLTKKEDTPFWKEVKYDLKLTSNLENQLDSWKRRLPVQGEFSKVKWSLFEGVNYIPVLYGLGWFDIDKIKKEYSFYSYLEEKIESFFERKKSENRSFTFASHKKVIQKYAVGNQ